MARILEAGSSWEGRSSWKGRRIKIVLLVKKAWKAYIDII
jgi:hypothetical protein